MAANFHVQACVDPQALGRVINYFAQLGMVPSRVEARATGDLMEIRIVQDELDDRLANIIAEKMRSSVLVEAVQLSHESPGEDAFR
jgi:hypothetical protein